jgi:hypothetical protein
MNFSSIFSLCVTLGLSARATFSFRPGRFDQLLERSVVQEPILLEKIPAIHGACERAVSLLMTTPPGGGCPRRSYQRELGDVVTTGRGRVVTRSGSKLHVVAFV